MLRLPLLLLAAALCHGADAPSAKQVIRAALAAGDIPLSIHPSCRGVGSEQTDANLRDYMSGLLANFTEPGAQNSIEVSAKPAQAHGPKSERRWDCRIVFSHVPGQDPFRYGIQFQMRPGGTVVRESVRCIGGG